MKDSGPFREGTAPRGSLTRMQPSPERPESRTKTLRSFFVGRVAALLATLVALTLIGIAVWGIWVSADVARQVAGGFFLLWLVFFGAFLFFGVVILWFTFSRRDRSWLTPLRLFTFVVSVRVATGESQRRSSDKPDEKALPAPHPPTQARQSPDSTRGAKDP
jgi:hypothetical protein